MKDFIGIGGETPEEILEILQANADDTEEMAYLDYFTQEELEEENSKLIDNLVDYEKLNDEFDNVKKDYNAKLKPLKERNKLALKQVKMGGIELKEHVYKFINHEDKQVSFYSKKGILIQTRPQLPSERQTTIIKAIRSNEAVKTPYVEDPNKRIESSKTGTSDDVEKDYRFIDKDDDDKAF